MAEWVLILWFEMYSNGNAPLSVVMSSQAVCERALERVLTKAKETKVRPVGGICVER